MTTTTTTQKDQTIMSKTQNRVPNIALLKSAYEEALAVYTAAERAEREQEKAERGATSGTMRESLRLQELKAARMRAEHAMHAARGPYAWQLDADRGDTNAGLLATLDAGIAEFEEHRVRMVATEHRMLAAIADARREYDARAEERRKDNLPPPKPIPVVAVGGIHEIASAIRAQLAAGPQNAKGHLAEQARRLERTVEEVYAAREQEERDRVEAARVAQLQAERDRQVAARQAEEREQQRIAEAAAHEAERERRRALADAYRQRAGVK